MAVIDNSFLSYAAGILADTNEGLSGSEICKHCNKYAVDYEQTITYPTQPFKKGTSNINKAQALEANLTCFEPEQQFLIIRELCELDKFADNSKVSDLKLALVKKYSHIAPLEIPEQIKEAANQLRQWLDDYPEAKKHYESALEKKNNKIYGRNLLDDLRLSLELLSRTILEHNKSLDFSTKKLFSYLKDNDVNTEIRNLYQKTFDIFENYQNKYVKHNDSFKNFEIDFIFNQTIILMQFLIKLHKENY